MQRLGADFEPHRMQFENLIVGKEGGHRFGLHTIPHARPDARVGDDEHHRFHPQLLEDRHHEGIGFDVAVFERDNHGLPGKVEFTRQVQPVVVERDGGVAPASEKFHLAAELPHRDAHLGRTSFLPFGKDAMVHQDAYSAPVAEAGRRLFLAGLRRGSLWAFRHQ